MRLWKTLNRRIESGIVGNADLLALWVVIIAIQPTVPVGHLLSREDLVPWLMLCLGAATFLRGKTYGDGPHTSLTQQQSKSGAMFQRLAMVASPLACMFWYDVGRQYNLVLSKSSEGMLAVLFACAGLFAVFLLLILSKAHQRTAWNPPGLSGVLTWGLGLISVLSGLLTIGWIEATFPSFHSDTLLLGVAFLVVGTIIGRTQNLRQRLAAKTKDGRNYVPTLFPYLFSSLGSAFGLMVLYIIQDFIGFADSMPFDLAFVPAAFVVAWAGVVWPKRTPIAVPCILHEVMPSGGGDKMISTTASPFDQPPEGALRINPLEIKRVRSLHPWLVPVKASRVAELDDPIRPLWSRREPPMSFHILGDASFEPDSLTNKAQWKEITVRLKGTDDVASVSGAAAQNRSLIVLKPFLRPGESRKKKIVTYRWEKPVPEGTVQHVDATTERLSLENGSIIVLATEGVARAFEVEIGSPVYQWNDAAGFRPPQIEDYVKV
jgi:hypothetical protein